MPKEPQFPWENSAIGDQLCDDTPNRKSIGPFVDSEKLRQERAPEPYRYRPEPEYPCMPRKPRLPRKRFTPHDIKSDNVPNRRFIGPFVDSEEIRREREEM